MANDFTFPRRARNGQFEDLRMILFTCECPVNLSVPGTHKNDCVWAKNRPTVLPQNQTVRSKYNQESILSFILPGEMNKAGDPGIVTERRFYENMLDLTL